MKTQVLNSVKASFDDIRCYGAVMFLEELIERKDEYSGAIPKYRITNLDTETEVTSVADIKNVLSEANVTITPYTGRNYSVSNTTPNLMIVINNLKVEIIPHVEEDAALVAEDFGMSGERIFLQVGYCNDNDVTIPVKLMVAGIC